MAKIKSGLQTVGQMLDVCATYHGAKRSKPVSAAIRPSSPQPAMMVVMGSGKTAQMLRMHESVTSTVQQHKFNRWSTQSAKRSIDVKAIAGRLPGDRGFGSTCPIRVVRKVLAVGRPEYLGARVWA